jgi:hypothetical protein
MLRCKSKKVRTKHNVYPYPEMIFPVMIYYYR